MAVAVCGMHYTGMAAMEVELDHDLTGAVNGIRPLLMIVPITLITAATLLGVAFSALQAMTEEEFTDGAVQRRGVHAEAPWSLRHASMTAIRRTPGQRPSPRPVVARPSNTAAAVPLVDDQGRPAVTVGPAAADS
jgi:hypothetical protein